MNVSKKEKSIIILILTLIVFANIAIMTTGYFPAIIFEPPIHHPVLFYSGITGITFFLLSILMLDTITGQQYILPALLVWASIPISIYFTKGISSLRRILYVYLLISYVSFDIAFLALSL